MKRQLLFGTIMLAAASLLAADAKDDVKAAAKKLADAGNYSWKTTSEGGAQRGGGAGPTEGQLSKDGVTHISITRGQNTTEAYLKGDKGAIKTGEEWAALPAADAAPAAGAGRGNRGAFAGRMFRNFKAPAVQAQEILAKVKELKKEDGAYSGDLTEEGAKELMRFGRGAAGGNGPEISDASGSAKFWVKDGVLSKLEYKVKGKMTFNNNDINIDRTTTTELKEVGTTKFEVPKEAKDKMS